jgi:hypothetical protein
MTETRDLGSSINVSSPNSPVAPGTYFVAHVTLQISAGAPPGTYDLASTTVAPHVSEVTSFDGTNFAEHSLPAAHYQVIIPEPGTLGLVGLGGIGLVAVLCIKKRAASI